VNFLKSKHTPVYFLKLHRATLMKYHAIKTMKANENGQILRGPPAPIFFKIQYFSLH
jgi:hypothetical protein